MTHEGRMSRGADKIFKGIKDSETEYYLANKVEPVVEKPIEVKRSKKKDG